MTYEKFLKVIFGIFYEGIKTLPRSSPLGFKNGKRFAFFSFLKISSKLVFGTENL
jgi:hypothetical protein